MSLVRRWTPSAIWGGVILTATSLPGSAIPPEPQLPGVDKIVHMAMYGVLGALVIRALARPRWPIWSLAVLVLIALAGVDELHQRWIPGRSADALDWAADVAGVTIGASLSRAARVRREIRT